MVDCTGSSSRSHRKVGQYLVESSLIRQSNYFLSYITTTFLSALVECNSYRADDKIRLWVQYVRGLAGLPVTQFARCQSKDRCGYVTSEIPDGPKDGHANKAFL
jgi:hypothetical protein